MRVIITILFVFLTLVLIYMASNHPAKAWSCAGGSCVGPNWSGHGAGNFTGAGDDPPIYAPQQPVIIVVPWPRPVYPRGYDQETGQCYDLDAC